MRKLMFLFLFPLHAFAGGGDDHSHGDEKAADGKVQTYFSSEVVSDKYELFVKYDPIHPGEEAVLRLFISEYLTNIPLDSASIKISSKEDKNIRFTATRMDEGYYEVKAIFPEAKKYSLSVTVDSGLGPDLLLLQNIEAGKELPGEDEEHAHSFLSSVPFLFGSGLIAGLAIMFLLMKARYRRLTAIFVAGLLMLPTASMQPVVAHEGHDEGNKKGNNFSNAFEVPKETQFLFDVVTQPVKSGAFNETTKLFGTVIPASNGQAVVQSPQTGKILNLNVRVGQKVSRGELLAVIEPAIEAGNMVSILSEKNNVDAELHAARREYERLKSIEDIAAKQDVAEAEARYQKARENKNLFNNLSNGKGNARAIFLRSPINGVVGNFTYSIGASVSANESILTVTDLSKVYVEAQVFDKDAEAVNTGKSFLVECANADEHKTAEVKLLAPAQSINPTNQTQRVIFAMENPRGDFKIGEFVNVRVFTARQSREIALPNSAISEINGRPVVFIKDSAEKYSVSYVTTAQNNGTHTVVKKGVEEGERIVANGTYQMKMIYLNQ
jgi:membrane fusion protein, heavy metal efflux system